MRDRRENLGRDSRRREHTGAGLVRRQERDDLLCSIERPMPGASQLRGIGRRPVERELRHLDRPSSGPSAGRPPGWRGAKPRVLGARGPGQIAERLDALVARDDVDPIANLEAPDEREHLVRGQVERVERQTQLVVPEEREEAKGAVAGPLETQSLGAGGDLGLDEGGRSRTIATS